MKIAGFAAAVMLGLATTGQAVDVSIVTDVHMAGAAGHGLAKLTAELDAGHISHEAAATVETAHGDRLLIVRVDAKLGGAEALSITKDTVGGKPAVMLTGSDATGLMYAEMEAAADFAGTTPATLFDRITPVTESPFLKQRGVTIYTMSRVYWESRFYDEKYWTKYLDTLAGNRFNALFIIFGYGNGGFTAPLYPYFFDTDGFGGVRLVGTTAEMQQKNVAALKRILAMAHARGIRVTVGIWDHIYRGGLQFDDVVNKTQPAPAEPTKGLVTGVTDENLVAYNTAAFAKFLKTFPEIDGLQFRMHNESGLKPGKQQDEFWHAMYRVLKENAPNMLFDARAKGLPDSEIEDAVAQGIHFRVNTKFWMEKMGMPWHPTHINPPNQKDRRHSYADMLRYPQTYKIEWGLWNGGTTRVLLWGDPEYARRFAESCALYNGDGFNVEEPLSTKMKGWADDAAIVPLFTEKYRFGEYESERYWHEFEVYGRMGYNPRTPAREFERGFIERFGKEAGAEMAAGLHEASWVLPRIVACCYRYYDFPMGRGWVEKECLGDLATYAQAEGSDTAQFAGFDEEAQNLISNTPTAKMRPEETAAWFAAQAKRIDGHIAAAEKALGTNPSKEAMTTLTDLKILSGLAAYHAARIPAAIAYDLHKHTGNPDSLNEAIQAERAAREAWKRVIAAAGDVYSDDLAMGSPKSRLAGHWKDELATLDRSVADLEAIQKRIDLTDLPATRHVAVPTMDGGDAPVVDFKPVTTAAAGQALTIRATAHASAGRTIQALRLRYRPVNQTLDYATLDMQPTGTAGEYTATIPGKEIPAAYDFMYYFEAIDSKGRGKIYPDFAKETPYVIVQVAR